jgi:environmental stress-induced protein Ves
VFPGVDRVLTVIEGGPMLLTLEGTEHHLSAESAPLFFPGDAACSARIEGGALLDFNVMLRRPLRAEVRKGPLTPMLGTARARLALLLEARAGLERLDLIDLDQAAPDLVVALEGADTISVAVFG